MPSARLRIAMVGGVPPVLGGGGLELQLARTTAALCELGHDARPAHAFAAGDALDVVHGFNHSGDVVHAVDHWRRAAAAFVISPVLVVEPSKEWRTRVGRHIPIPTFPPRALRDLVRKADAVVGLTAWERDFMIRQGGVDAAKCVVVGNGVDPVQPATAGLPTLPERFVVSLGSVSARKRQAEIAQTLAAAGEPYVVIGGLEGEDPEAFRAAVAATGGAWLGEISDPPIVRAILQRAAALVLLSEREGQSLAVLEALATGTPVVGSDLPSHRELQAAYPGWVELAADPAGVAAAARRVSQSAADRPAPQIPTWTQVASDLEGVYATAMARGARTGQAR